jgi:hypothetical protein
MVLDLATRGDKKTEVGEALVKPGALHPKERASIRYIVLGGELMKLTYRGVSYDYTPPVVEYGQVYGFGKYRGASVGFRSATVPAVEQPSADLTYRGVDYRSGVPSGVEPMVPTAVEAAAVSTETAPVLSMAERMRMLAVKHVRNIRQREQSLLARLDEEVGLTAEDAAHYESHIQGKLRHNFWQTYDRSSAAMS